MKVLETNRLILRWFSGDDAGFIHELLNEPAWIAFIGDRGIQSLQDARNYIETVAIASYVRHGFGLFAIELKPQATVIGMCGLIKREGLEDVDLGFALLSRFEGQGMASEAAAATLDYARNSLELQRVVAITRQDNERSRRVLERIGLRFERLVRLSADSAELRLYSISLTAEER